MSLGVLTKFVLIKKKRVHTVHIIYTFKMLPGLFSNLFNSKYLMVQW